MNHVACEKHQGVAIRFQENENRNRTANQAEFLENIETNSFADFDLRFIG